MYNHQPTPKQATLLAALDRRGEYGGSGPYGATTGWPDPLIQEAAATIRQLIEEKNNYE